MATDKGLRAARIVSLVASTCISLAAGTNYVYSAYAPQLAERLRLSATESNLIGTFGNLAIGIPSGMLVDSRGPRLPVLIGGVSLFLGYFPMHLAMTNGEGSIGVPALCFFSALTGFGSCSAFGGAMKAAALNFPRNRGTATAIPLASFGLSAFFFSRLSSWLFPGNSSDFLLVLAVATSGMCMLSFCFLRVVPVPGAYSAVSPAEPAIGSSRLHRTKSGEGRRSSSKHLSLYQEPGTATANNNYTNPHFLSPTAANLPNPDETSSFLSKSTSSSSSSAEECCVDAESTAVVVGDNSDVHHGHYTDIRGWALTKSTDFWLLFSVLGLFTGVGLMTINNIGHSVQALWFKYAPDTHPDYVQQNQALHVSILSLCNFSGRMLSGTSSDILQITFKLQRHWLIAAAGCIFGLAQVCAMMIENPHWLWLVSSLSGLAYGVLFGVFPTIISEAFGLHGLSQNWGTMTLSSIISGQIFNLLYGRIYDAHSTIVPSGGLECHQGLACYRNSYMMTLGSSLLGLTVTLLTIRRNSRIDSRGVAYHPVGGAPVSP
ncbi:hypothetical protein RUND412_000492 [Rhizina undulata]